MDLINYKDEEESMHMTYHHTHTTHHLHLISGQAATGSSDGYKDVYYCDGCGRYFADAKAEDAIGGKDAYEEWKTSEEGKVIPAPETTLPENDPSGPADPSDNAPSGMPVWAIVLIVVVSVAVVGGVVYFVLIKKKK